MVGRWSRPPPPARRRGEPGAREPDLLIHRAGIDAVPFDADQAPIARGAFRRFGKGRHPAGPNLGDRFACALSKATGESLLFTGEDFTLTDVTPC